MLDIKSVPGLKFKLRQSKTSKTSNKLIEQERKEEIRTLNESYWCRFRLLIVIIKICISTRKVIHKTINNRIRCIIFIIFKIHEIR